MERSIDAQALRTVLEGAEVSSVEGSSRELRLTLADGDQIRVEPAPSSEAERAPSLSFFHEAAFSD